MNRPVALEALSRLATVLNDAHEHKDKGRTVKTDKIAKFGEGFIDYLALSGFKRVTVDFREGRFFPEDGNRDRLKDCIEILEDRTRCWQNSHESAVRLMERDKAEEAARLEKTKRRARRTSIEIRLTLRTQGHRRRSRTRKNASSSRKSLSAARRTIIPKSATSIRVAFLPHIFLYSNVVFSDDDRCIR